VNSWSSDDSGLEQTGLASFGVLVTYCLPPNVFAVVNGVAFCETLAGQLFFDWLGNKMGRKRVYGFGIGGDYPLSAMIMSKYANKKTRGAFIAAVFAMQGFVPAATTYYWRMKMPETARYTALVAKNAEQAAADMSKVLQVKVEVEKEKIKDKSNLFGLFSKQFVIRHGWHLVGTALCWFLVDIAYYSHNLFQKDIFFAIGWIPPAKTMNAIDEVYKIARAQTLIKTDGRRSSLR
ncbi:hypothetical protein GIB67_024135, partial [Kingdonia uniflora]